MIRSPHRRLASALVLAVVVLALSACTAEQKAAPNSTFLHNSEHNTDIIALWDRILFLGMLVFILVEALLVYTIFRYRAKPGAPMPKQVHGNHVLEIVWTLIPVAILIPIAIPTVQTIFKTQAPAVADALQVEVIGHQWWWEFRYPAYGVVTANELYLPAGKTVNFTLRSKDVLHSFWTPGLAGKRDLITNKTNFLWYTPDPKLAEDAFNGFCTEYCGASHANMRFRVFTTTPENFESWAGHQKDPASSSPAALATGYIFPADKMPAHTVPQVPIPDGLTFDDALLVTADAAAGRAMITNLANLGKTPCLTCHVIKGEQALVNDNQAAGPNLTHVGSRHTFAGGLFTTNAQNLARWLKNPPKMKPGSLMNVFGIGEYSPQLKGNVTAGLSDKEIADIVAYLLTLK